jgi:Protein of unknown function (DUF2934)
MHDAEERIRRLAYDLWLEDGRPEGRSQEHWYKAQDFLRTEDFILMVPNPNPAAEAEDHPRIVADRAASARAELAQAAGAQATERRGLNVRPPPILAPRDVSHREASRSGSSKGQARHAS